MVAIFVLGIKYVRQHALTQKQLYAFKKTWFESEE
jgi:hypothetical protein